MAQLCVGLFGIVFSLFCFLGFPVLLGGIIWAIVDAILIFTGSVKDNHGRKAALGPPYKRAIGFGWPATVLAHSRGHFNPAGMHDGPGRAGVDGYGLVTMAGGCRLSATPITVREQLLSQALATR